MEQDHLILQDGEYDPCNPQRKAAAHFSQTRLEFAHQRHAERPSQLHGLDIDADNPAVFLAQAFEPLADRLVTCGCAIEDDFKNNLGLFHTRLLYQK